MRSKEGFSLVEVLVVITIILLLVALLGGAFSRVMGDTHERVSHARVMGLGAELTRYKVKFGAYPAALIEAASMVNRPQWLDKGAFVDGYGRPIQYVPSDRTFRLWSLGPDGVSGTADDIVYPSN